MPLQEVLPQEALPQEERLRMQHYRLQGSRGDGRRRRVDSTQRQAKGIVRPQESPRTGSRRGGWGASGSRRREICSRRGQPEDAGLLWAKEEVRLAAAGGTRPASEGRRS